MAAATINPALLNSLTLKWGRERANLDDQQNRLRINYTSALDKMKRGYQDTELKGREGFADRGMLHSGPSLATGAKLKEESLRQQSDAGTAYTTNLATIARNRLLNNQDYNSNRLLAAAGYTTG